MDERTDSFFFLIRALNDARELYILPVKRVSECAVGQAVAARPVCVCVESELSAEKSAMIRVSTMVRNHVCNLSGRRDFWSRTRLKERVL